MLAGYGGWKNTYRRFCRRRDQSILETLLTKLVTEPDLEWSHIKVHPNAAGARDGNKVMGPLIVDAHDMPGRVSVTSPVVADSIQDGTLIQVFSAEYQLADKGYDSHAICSAGRRSMHGGRHSDA